MFKTRSTSLFLCFLALASAERQLQTTGDHDWAYSLTTAVASFGQATANQFLFTFANGASLTDANAVIETLWDATCTTPVTAGMTASASAVNAAVTTASVSVDFSALGNDVWTATPTAGTLTFCYKSDIQIEGQSMNYVETIVTATFSLVNAFPDITGLDVLDKAAGSSALTAAINYPLLAVPCDASDATLTSPTFAPGSSLRICITMSSTVAGVTLGSVYSAVLTQATTAITSTPIALGVVTNSFTSTACSATLCTVETTVVGAFFADDTKALSMTGSVLMQVGRRMVEVPVPSIRGARNMVGADAKGDFAVAVPLAANSKSASSASESSMIFAAASLFALALV